MLGRSCPNWAVYLVLPNFLLASIAPADEQEHAETPIASQAPAENVAMSGSGLIDMHLRNAWMKQKLTESPIEANDVVWMRRAYLDILGRIPTQTEIVEFGAMGGKRPDLCEKLVNHPEFASHLANIWTEPLTHLEADRRNLALPATSRFLARKFQAGEGWDKIARDFLTSDEFIGGTTGGERAELATETASKALLGIDTYCAKCHNQPELTDEKPANPSYKRFLSQADYAGIHALMEKSGGGSLGATRDGEIFTVNPGFDKKVGSVGDVLTQHESFPRAFVNRMWANFFGAGLNSSDVDDFRADDKVNHPELLRDLSAKFVASGYNVKELAKWICQSNAYSLSSTVNESNKLDEKYFSRAMLRRMTADQLADSLVTALGSSAVDRNSWLQVLRNPDSGAFAEERGKPARFNYNIRNQLALMNSDQMNRALKAAPEIKLPAPSAEQLKDKVDATLGRAPTPDEVKLKRIFYKTLSRAPKLNEYQKFGEIRPNIVATEGVDGYWEAVLWSVVNSNEFILNH